MDCTEARTLMLDLRRGALASELRAPLEAHLAQCESCRRENEADRALSTLLESRLPRPPAPASLRRTLEERWAASPEHAPRPVRRKNVVRTVVAMAVGAALAVLVLFAWRARDPGDAMVAEAVNDHLRVLYSDRPLEIESSDRHVVKPWFKGRVDFAPDFRFEGDEDFPLQGGAVAYFLDRKAATFVFKRRLHWVTLFVFRADGLPWPAVATEAVGPLRGTLRTSRGFHVLLWRKGDLGYGLVSDVDERDVKALADKIARD
jgi:anti-sigma factor RsiW